MARRRAGSRRHDRDFGLPRDAIALHYVEDVRSRLVLLDLDGQAASDEWRCRHPARSKPERDARRPHRAHVQLVLLPAGAVPLRRAQARADARISGRARSRHRGVHARSAERAFRGRHTDQRLLRAQGRAASRQGEPRARCTATAASMSRSCRSSRAARSTSSSAAASTRSPTCVAAASAARPGTAPACSRTSRTCSRTSSGGYAGPRRGEIATRAIAITGGSNGGLLVGALLTRAPDAFRAAAAYVGLYDMLRYTLFPPARALDQRVRRPAATRSRALSIRLLAVSPRAAGTHYPAVLIETADHDTRVHYAHSTKFAARLQEAQAGPYPIYFYMEHEQGHGHGTPLRTLVRPLRPHVHVPRRRARDEEVATIKPPKASNVPDDQRNFGIGFGVIWRLQSA